MARQNRFQFFTDASTVQTSTFVEVQGAGIIAAWSSTSGLGFATTGGTPEVVFEAAPADTTGYGSLGIDAEMSTNATAGIDFADHLRLRANLKTETTDGGINAEVRVDNESGAEILTT